MLTENGRGSYLMQVEFVGGGKTQITVDSGAEESVCPKEWGKQFGTQEVGKPRNFKNANGTVIAHYGERKVQVVSPF